MTSADAIAESAPDPSPAAATTKPPDAESKLGRKRPRPARPEPVRVGIDTPTRIKTTHGGSVIDTGLQRAIRAPLASLGDGDDLDTLCLDRDALAIALLPDARLALPHAPPQIIGPQLPVRPVPHFRSRDMAERHRQEPTVIIKPRSVANNLPLGVWVAAAMVAGLISFHVVPRAKNVVSDAIHAHDDPERPPRE